MCRNRVPACTLVMVVLALRARYRKESPSASVGTTIWSSPRKVDTELRVVQVIRPLELLVGHIPQGGVPADAVVERLDVLEDTRLRLLACGVLLVVDQLPLQAGEEALHRRVVPAVGAAAHATGDP